MKFTKFAQSCVLVETNGKRILVDPGSLQYEDSLLPDYWTNIDLILVTHKHMDHCHVEAIKSLLNQGAILFSSKEVQQTYPELKIHILKEGDVLNLPQFKVEVTKAVHGYTPLLKGKEIHENIGFIIDDGKTRAYFTSDTICFPHEYRCDIIFVPVCNHGLVMGPFEAALFAKETGARLAVPIHYDNPKYPVELESVKAEWEKQGLKYKIMDVKETIEF